MKIDRRATIRARGRKEISMKKTAKVVLKKVISVIYILWGIAAPLAALKAALALNVPALISAGVGILMLLAGILGLIGLKKLKCRIFGIIIFVFSLVGVITSLPTLNVNSIVTALLSWLFIIF